MLSLVNVKIAVVAMVLIWRRESSEPYAAASGRPLSQQPPQPSY